MDEPVGPASCATAHVSRAASAAGVAWQNTLSKAAPLILTALCTALPARLGLIIIGGEGALVLGGLAAAAAGVPLSALPFAADRSSACCSPAWSPAALLIALVGGLRHWRGVNATISSLLLTYIVLGVFNYLVEGPLRDPASLNKPSTCPIGAERGASAPCSGLDVHWGLVFGIVACVLAYDPDGPHDVRLRGADDRRQRPRGAGGRPAGRPADPRHLPAGRGRGRTGRQASRSPPSTGRPTPPLRRPATATPASWCRSSPAIIRWASFPSRSCSAASRRPPDVLQIRLGLARRLGATC